MIKENKGLDEHCGWLSHVEELNHLSQHYNCHLRNLYQQRAGNMNLLCLFVDASFFGCTRRVFWKVRHQFEIEMGMDRGNSTVFCLAYGRDLRRVRGGGGMIFTYLRHKSLLSGISDR